MSFKTCAFSVILGFALSMIIRPGTAAFADLKQASPWLGIAIEAGKKGVMVREVIKGTPAEENGLRAGDEITAVKGATVTQPKQLIEAVQAAGVGNTVKVEYLRDGKPESKDIKLVARPDDLELVRGKIMGTKLPTVAFETIHGADFSTNEKLAGKVVVLEFWATWCPSCRSTHSRLSDYAMAAAPRGITVLALSDEEAPLLKTYAASTKPNFAILRATDHKLFEDWIVAAIPMIVVLDKTGVVRFVTIGGGSYLEEALSAADKLAAGP